MGLTATTYRMAASKVSKNHSGRSATSMEWIVIPFVVARNGFPSAICRAYCVQCHLPRRPSNCHCLCVQQSSRIRYPIATILVLGVERTLQLVQFSLRRPLPIPSPISMAGYDLVPFSPPSLAIVRLESVLRVQSQQISVPGSNVPLLAISCR